MRIVSLAPSNTEILFEIGAGDQIVATTSLCDFPEEARKLPSIGGWTNPDIERVESFEPDLVLASDELQDEAVEELEENGLEVLQVKPHRLDEVFDSIIRIGEKVGKRSEAVKVVESMKSEINDIDLENTKVYCEEWMDPPMASGNWVPDLIEKGNGEYFIESGRSREFELEELKQFDPELIVLHICGAGPGLDPSIIERREDWEEIEAVQNENVFVVDDSLLNRPGPRLVEGVKKIEERV